MNETLMGATYENLLGGNEQVLLTRNVATASDTTIAYGELLAGAFNGSDVTVHAATLSDTVGSELFVAAEDVIGSTVATVFESGRFNRSAIKTTLDVRQFEAELRRQGIFLTEAR